MSVIITGEGRFTVGFFTPATGGFPGGGSARYEMGRQCLFRSSGVLADQVDVVHAQRYTFVASTAQEIDLLALVGPKIRLIMGKILTGNDATLAGVTAANAAATLTFGGAALNAWAVINGLTIYPGTTLNHGGFDWSAPGLAGAPVSSGSKMWKMLPSAHAFTFDLLMFGSSS